MLKVTILQYRMLHYRLELFELLKKKLATYGVELEVVHGQASAVERKRKDEGVLPWAKRVNNLFIRLGGKDIVWQGFPVSMFKSKLIITMQENRILSNYFILLIRHVLGFKVGYWGHGKNYQSTNPDGFREKWKIFLLNKIDWWFAYTNSTVAHLTSHGYPSKKITNLENAIDVVSFQSDIDKVTDSEMLSAKQLLNIPVDAKVALFCGSLYPEKRIDLLIDSILKVKEKVPNFHLIVIGDGPSADLIVTAASTNAWIHPVGVKRGHEKAVLFKLSHVQLNPGLVGLHILDAFSASLPMITTSTALHSPEIDYLNNNVNGIIIDGDSSDLYANVTQELLLDEEKLNYFRLKCKESAAHYTVQNMVDNFSFGIVSCLINYGFLDSNVLLKSDEVDDV